MCGVCGEIRFEDGPVFDSAMMQRFREPLSHRGPDSAGMYASPDGRAGLGFQRLRIVDLSSNGNQPMPNETGSVQLVFNGEIYNFAELRQQLEQRGHRFRSSADSEVIVHLYEDLGSDCVAELDGMFALAIWDQHKRKLILARDRAGKKPLFYSKCADTLVFASEIKALFAHPAVSLQIDSSSVPYYFIHGYVPTPDTFYKGIRQVEPATLMTVDSDGNISKRSYWTLQYPTRSEARRSVDPREVRNQVRTLTKEAVRKRLVSDVPLGAFLSGGIDSSIVVGLMTELTDSPVKTFSIGFEGDPRYDETSYAKLVAERFGADHTEFRVKPNAIDLVEKLIWHHDGPFGDSSAVPTFIVSQLTREHVTVVLTGDGGDELFAGYSRFYAGLLAERIPRVVGTMLNQVTASFGAVPSGRDWRARAQRFTRAMNLPLYERMTRWSSLFFDDLELLLSPTLRSELPAIDRLRYIVAERRQMEPLSTLGKLLHANYKTYLLDDLLVKTDRCTMANSLEARSPFLDTALVEYAATIPDALKLRRGRTKIILRDAFADLLPQKIITRGKMGFGVPFGTWFRTDLREYLSDLLLVGRPLCADYLSLDYVRQLITRHLDGQADLGLQLWSILCFEQWLRILPDWRRNSTVAANNGSIVR